MGPNKRAESVLIARKSIVPSDKLQALQIDRSLFITEKKSRIKKEYKILEQLGEGSYGIVKKVLHVPTGSLRALKQISKMKATPQ